MKFLALLLAFGASASAQTCGGVAASACATTTGCTLEAAKCDLDFTKALVCVAKTTQEDCTKVAADGCAWFSEGLASYSAELKDKNCFTNLATMLSFSSVKTEAACTGAGGTWKPQECVAFDECKSATSADCIKGKACYWSEPSGVTIKQGDKSAPLEGAGCAKCIDEGNQYLLEKDFAEQTCTASTSSKDYMVSGTITVKNLAVSAGTDCTGGTKASKSLGGRITATCVPKKASGAIGVAPAWATVVVLVLALATQLA